MSFTLTACQPYPFRKIERPRRASVICLVGVDTEFALSYFASAELSPFDEDGAEFLFRVIQRPVGGDEYSFRSGQQTRGLFAKPDRAVILRVICSATEQLLLWRRPAWVDRCSTDVYPPAKAMVKHERITEVFTGCGYKVTEKEDWHGRRQWRCDAG